jgi:hypothetical protein
VPRAAIPRASSTNTHGPSCGREGARPIVSAGEVTHGVALHDLENGNLIVMMQSLSLTVANCLQVRDASCMRLRVRLHPMFFAEGFAFSGQFSSQR